MPKLLSGAEIVFKSLEDQKVEYIFGYPGGAVLPIYDELKNHKSINTKVYSSIINLIKLRKKQPAFHPNATQFTLQLEDHFFGIWRQSIDRSQSIFCISNLTKFRQKLSLLDVNLIAMEKWYDILSKSILKNLSGSITLAPYQSVWITNKRFF